MLKAAEKAVLISHLIALNRKLQRKTGSLCKETAHGPGGSGCRISAAQLVGVGKIDIVQGKISQGGNKIVVVSTAVFLSE